MTKHVSKEKLSKKQQKAENARHRTGWGQTNPVTRVVQSKKLYSRKIKHKGKADE